MTRKRANATKNKDVVMKKKQAQPLMQREAQYFQELVDVNNRYTALLKQKAQYEFVLNKLQEHRTKVQKGKVKLPVQITLIPKLMTYPEEDKKEILKIFDEQIVSYKNSIKSIEGQLQHRYDEYLESATRTKEFMVSRYGDYKAKQLTQNRKQIDDEENLFEAEFKKLMEDSETMAEFKRQKAEAIKKNIARKTKYNCKTCSCGK